MKKSVNLKSTDNAVTPQKGQTNDLQNITKKTNTNPTETGMYSGVPKG